MSDPITDTEAHIEKLLDALTLEEQVSLLAGAQIWTTEPIPRLGIPAIKVSDGPNGARGGGSLVGGKKAACFPAAISLASTWNTELIEQVGQALAGEARSKGARVLLAPTVNIHRSPLNGRNFECYSEDPYLSSQIAVAYITGLQRQGVAATIKHFIGNESEFERMTISSEIDERSLREIYMPAFEAAVKQAHVWALMSSYNRLHGSYVSERADLLRDILKQEWGFDGIVMSDWFATHSTAAALNGGMDLEMPGPARYRGAALLAAVQAGEVQADDVRESARRMLRLITRVGAFDDPDIPEEQAIDRPEDRALIRQAGAEGIVLLKNDGLLPIDPQRLGRVAIIGPNAQTAQIMGGGSAQLNAHYRVSPYEGIVAQLGEQVAVSHAVGCSNYRSLPLIPGVMTVEYFNGRDLAGPVVSRGDTTDSEIMWMGNLPPEVDPRSFSARLSLTYIPAESGEHQFSLISAGVSRLLVDGVLLVDNWSDWRSGDTFFGAGSDERIAGIELQAGQHYAITIEYACPTGGALGISAVRAGAIRPLGEAELAYAEQIAAEADLVVLCVGLNGEWDSEGRDRPHIDLVGRQNELVARVAAANPRTVVVLQSGGPLTMPWLEQVAAVMQAWYPGQECGNAIADVLFGNVNPAGRLPQSFPARLADNPAYLNYPGENGRVRYGEGLFVGYRYYEKKVIAPLFPFGFGLSYTSFRYHNLRLSRTTIDPAESVTVQIDITNDGRRPGQEVVQLYVRDVAARLARPEKELKGFAKVALEPGETRSVTLTLDRSAFAYWDDAAHAWVAEAGSFSILIGSSSQDIRAEVQLELDETVTFR